MKCIPDVVHWIYAHIDIPSTTLVFTMVVYVLILAKWHMSKGTFDFKLALLDPPHPDGASLSRLGQLTALVVSTAIIIYFAVLGKLQEWLFGLYIGTWAGTYLATKWSPKSVQQAKESVGEDKNRAE